MMRFALLAALLLAACAPDAPPPPPKPKATAATKPDPDALPVYRVAVAPNGLLLTDPRGGGAKPAEFGLRQSLLLAILARSFGPPTEGRDDGCGHDFARWPNGLTLWFDTGDFVGWSLEAGSPPLVAVAPGVVRADVMRAGAGKSCG